MEKEKIEYPDLTLSNKKATTNQEKVNLFKQFLETTFITEPEHKISDREKELIEKDILNDNDLETIKLNENHKDINIEELTIIVQKLDIKKACGEDKITNKLIMLIYGGTKDFIFKLFNSSLYHRYYPKVLKKSQITMLHKSGKPKLEITLYRLLSLTGCLGKILKKIITNRVKDWCIENDLINKQQNGFRSKGNTNDNLFKLTQSLKQNIKKGFVTSAVFLDVEKAFDQVCHTGLLHKMKKFGIDHSLLIWMKSFLSERSISVKIKNIKTDFFTTKHEVPQGSPLSQILIIIYVSDIPQPENAQTTTLLQFADDIAPWSYGRNTIMSGCKTQKHLDKIRKWCNMWRIKLNPLKTKVLHFSKRKHHLLDCKIKMDNVQLKAEKTVKFLGVIFDHKLTFEEHGQDKIDNTRHMTSSFYSLKSKNYRIPEKKYDKPT